MKYISLLIIALIIYALPINADAPPKKTTDANLVGHVIDAKTKEHIPYVTVLVKGTTIGVSTDMTGHYFIKHLPVGKHTIVFQSEGFATIEREIEVVKDETKELNVEMKEDAIMLNETVVSANRNETKRREATTIVNVINTKLFETTNSVTLSQGLSFQPGLRVENNCQNCGFQQVRINGLEGPYSQILIDSKPIFGSLAGVYGIEQIPANMVERVEVVRGGGSAIFGSSAIGGTINIITKEPLYNTFQVSDNMTLIAGNTVDNTASFNAGLVTDDNKAGIHMFGMTRNRNPYDHDGDGFSEMGKLESTTVGFRSYYKTSHYSKISLEYHHIKEFRRGGNEFGLPPHEADIAEQLDHNIHGGGLSFLVFSKDYKHKLDIYTSMQYVGRKSYYGSEQNLDAYGRTKNITLVAGTQYVYNFDKLWFMPAALTAGAEYNYDDLDDEGMKNLNRDVSQTINSGSFYVQNEWKTAKLSLLIGGRLDKHNLIDNVIFSPRANVRYSPISDLSFRGTLSTGFRAPQAFDEDLHVLAAQGEMSYIRIADGLKPEYSNSFSLSADYVKMFGSVQTNILLEGFYTKLDDVFITPIIGKDSFGNTVKERQNGPGATVKGFNIESRIIFSRLLQLQLGATIQSSKYKEPYHWSDDTTVEPVKNMLRTPDFYGYFTATSQLFKNFEASVTGTYTGRMYVPHLAGYTPNDRLEHTCDFFDMNIKLAYNIKLSSLTLQLNAGVQNIFNSYQSDFDKGINRDASYIYGPMAPRSVFFGLKLGLQ